MAHFQYAFCTAPTKTTSTDQKFAQQNKKNGTGVSAPSALFQLYLSRAKIKSILMPPGKKGLGSFRRETIMIGFILLWGQKWEANSIVSVYMHDKAAKQIFKRD